MKQYRIGIIGTENWHAHEFTAFFNKPDENGSFAYPDCHVTMVYGHYPEDNERRVKEDGADRIAESIEEMVENVDAVMITARDGKFHAEFAKPFIEASIPAFIDKPFTVDPKEAIELIKLAKEKNVPLCGGSSLKYVDDILCLKKFKEEAGDKISSASFSAPLDYSSVYSGFYFYAPHLAEMTLETFGYYPESVVASEKKGCVTTIVGYENFDVSNHFNDGTAGYHGSIYTKDGNCHREVELTSCYKRECDIFVNMIRTGKMERPYEELVTPVLYMNAAMESLRTGKRVEISYDDLKAF